MDRRDFLKTAGAAMVAGAIINPAFAKSASTEAKGKGSKVSDVYFTKDLSAAGFIKLYNLVNKDISGKVALKVHTGEQHGPNILPREWVQKLQATIPNSTIVETNTYYAGGRDTTEKHRETLKVNGWTFCPVDIMDEDGDTPLPIRNGKWLKEVAV